MSLEEAIKKAHLFYQNNKRYPVSRTEADPAAYTSLGYGTANGAAKRALATLLGYGLLEKLAGGDDSKIRLSDLGFNIIAARDDDPMKEELIAEAARKPKVFRDLLNEFSDGLPASDTPIHSFLIRQGFTLEAVRPLIRDFRATVSYAKLFERAKMEEEEREDELAELEDELDERMEEIDRRKAEREEQERRKAAMIAASVLEPPQGMEAMPVPLGIGKKMILYFPKDVTADDLEFFNMFWAGFQKRLKLAPQGEAATPTSPSLFPFFDAPKPPAPSVRTGKAVWRNKDVDQPVTVSGYYGEMGGRHFARIEGSASGVPLDELVYDE